jgi:hypothetical protein
MSELIVKPTVYNTNIEKGTSFFEKSNTDNGKLKFSHVESYKTSDTFNSNLLSTDGSKILIEDSLNSKLNLLPNYSFCRNLDYKNCVILEEFRLQKVDIPTNTAIETVYNNIDCLNDFLQPSSNIVSSSTNLNSPFQINNGREPNLKYLVTLTYRVTEQYLRYSKSNSIPTGGFYIYFAVNDKFGKIPTNTLYYVDDFYSTIDVTLTQEELFSDDGKIYISLALGDSNLYGLSNTLVFHFTETTGGTTPIVTPPSSNDLIQPHSTDPHPEYIYCENVISHKIHAPDYVDVSGRYFREVIRPNTLLTVQDDTLYSKLADNNLEGSKDSQFLVYSENLFDENSNGIGTSNSNIFVSLITTEQDSTFGNDSHARASVAFSKENLSLKQTNPYCGASLKRSDIVIEPFNITQQGKPGSFIKAGFLPTVLSKAINKALSYNTNLDSLKVIFGKSYSMDKQYLQEVSVNSNYKYNDYAVTPFLENSSYLKAVVPNSVKLTEFSSGVTVYNSRLAADHMYNDRLATANSKAIAEIGEFVNYGINPEVDSKEEKLFAIVQENKLDVFIVAISSSVTLDYSNVNKLFEGSGGSTEYGFINFDDSDDPSFATYYSNLYDTNPLMNNPRRSEAVSVNVIHQDSALSFTSNPRDFMVVVSYVKYGKLYTKWSIASFNNDDSIFNFSPVQRIITPPIFFDTEVNGNYVLDTIVLGSGDDAYSCGVVNKLERRNNSGTFLCTTVAWNQRSLDYPEAKTYMLNLSTMEYSETYLGKIENVNIGDLNTYTADADINYLDSTNTPDTYLRYVLNNIRLFKIDSLTNNYVRLGMFVDKTIMDRDYMNTDGNSVTSANINLRNANDEDVALPFSIVSFNVSTFLSGSIPPSLSISRLPSDYKSSYVIDVNDRTSIYPIIYNIPNSELALGFITFNGLLRHWNYNYNNYVNPILYQAHYTVTKAFEDGFKNYYSNFTINNGFFNSFNPILITTLASTIVTDVTKFEDRVLVSGFIQDPSYANMVKRVYYSFNQETTGELNKDLAFVDYIDDNYYPIENYLSSRTLVNSRIFGYDENQTTFHFGFSKMYRKKFYSIKFGGKYLAQVMYNTTIVKLGKYSIQGSGGGSDSQGATGGGG